MIKYIKWVLSPEFFFGLYLVAGYFKSAVTFIPIDLTSLLLVITMAAAGVRLYKNGFTIPKPYLTPIIAFVILQIIVLVSLLYTSGTAYTFDKAARFLVITAWCFFGGFFLIKDRSSFWKIIAGISTISLLMGISSVVGSVSASNELTTTFGSNYLALARASVVGALVFVSFFIFSRASMLMRISSLVIGVLLTVPLLESGGRLAVFVFAVVILSLPFMMLKVKKKDVLISKKLLPILMMFVVIGSFGSFFISKGYADTLVYRMEVMLTQDGGGESVSGRADRLGTGLQMAEDSYLMGKGINSFPTEYAGLPTDTPHNMYVEYLAELGVIAFVTFIFIVCLSFYRAIKVRGMETNNLLVSTLLLISTFWLINSVGSSSINNDKLYYAFLAMMLILPHILKGERTENATK